MAATAELTAVRARVSADEWQVRVDLAAAYRLVAHYGWDDLIFTHISARVPGPEHNFLINPYGLLFDEITASNLVKVDLDGAIVEPSPYIVNPAGFTIHSAIHAAREDANCILHLHTVAAIAVSCQEDGLLPLNQTSMLFNEQLAYHEYEGLALSVDERPRLVADLGTKNAMLLRNHGALTVGRNAADAFQKMYLLERACAMQVAALSGGVRLHIPGPDVQEVVRKQALHGLTSQDAQLIWDALRRMLDKKDPSYKT